MPDDQGQVLPASHFEKVGANYMYYDSIWIGPGWKSRAIGWFDTFTEMAQKGQITFFNVRSGSKDGYAYTNMDSTDQIGRPYRCESLGMRFNYPNPYTADQHSLNYAASKFFQTTLPEHCHFEFWVRDDQWFILKPHMAPPGYGPQGDLVQNSVAPSASDIITSGVPHGMNRWHWLGDGIKIPETAQVKLILTFSEYAKQLLIEMDQVFALDGRNEEPFPNAASIEVSIRGIRYSQMKGKYYK